MSGTRRILVVDDDHDIVRGTRLRLDRAGYETLAAYDGEEAIDSAAAHHPDAIVLDVRMPHMNGLAALDGLRHRSDTKEIPVIMLSASLVDQNAALDGGARFFLRKPYHGETLLAAVEAVLSETELQEER